MRRLRLRSQGRIIAALRGKFNGKPMTYAADHKNLAAYLGYSPAKCKRSGTRLAFSGAPFGLFLTRCMSRAGGRPNEKSQGVARVGRPYERTHAIDARAYEPA